MYIYIYIYMCVICIYVYIYIYIYQNLLLIFSTVVGWLCFAFILFVLISDIFSHKIVGTKQFNFNSSWENVQ